jgi:hypothetical protein
MDAPSISIKLKGTEGIRSLGLESQTSGPMKGKGVAVLGQVGAA